MLAALLNQKSFSWEGFFLATPDLTKKLHSGARNSGISFKAILPKIKNHSLTNQEAVRGAEKLISHFVMKENGLQILAEHFNKQIKN